MTQGVADWGPAGKLESGGPSRPISAWVAAAALGGDTIIAYNENAQAASVLRLGVEHSLTYNADGTVATKSGGGRVWTYGYTDGLLTSVVVS